MVTQKIVFYQIGRTEMGLYLFGFTRFFQNVEKKWENVVWSQRQFFKSWYNINQKSCRIIVA